MCDIQPNIASKQRLSVRYARAVAPLDSRYSKTATKQRLSVTVNRPSRDSVSLRRRRRRTRFRCTPRVAEFTSTSPIETIPVVNLTGVGATSHHVDVATPSTASTITQVPQICWDDLLRDLKRGNVEQLCLVVRDPALGNLKRPEGLEFKSARKVRFAAHSWEELAA